MFAKFLDKLKATPDGDGNLLDHTTLLYGSCLSNSNIHNHNPLPTLLAGGGAGTLKGGRHLKYPENTPMSNLLLSVLNKMGVPADKVGDSTSGLRTFRHAHAFYWPEPSSPSLPGARRNSRRSPMSP